MIINQSSMTSLDEQKQEISHAWEELEEPRPRVSVEIIPDGEPEKKVIVIRPDLKQGEKSEPR